MCRNLHPISILQLKINHVYSRYPTEVFVHGDYTRLLSHANAGYQDIHPVHHPPFSRKPPFNSGARNSRITIIWQHARVAYEFQDNIIFAKKELVHCVRGYDYFIVRCHFLYFSSYFRAA